MKNIEMFIDEGGDVSIGPLGQIPCVAAAADHHNTVAMLARRDGERVAALLRRLDKAIAAFYANGTTTDEIN
jgi:short subunit dehydrogenase-like uncharacterized protein